MSRDTLGDGGSLVELGEAGTGLVPWQASVSTAHADSALHPHRARKMGRCGMNFISLTCLVPEYQGSAFSSQ